MEKKRVLWLLNHTTLRDFEVPMLIEMGYEVFTPKIYQYEFGDLSASVTYAYDETLSIPREVLELLNGVDFYADRVSEEVAEVMNTYFDMAIFGAFSPQVKMLVRTFRGVLLFQAFGLDKTMSYTRVFADECNSLLDEIMACGSRFWFGASYENLAEVEMPFFQKQYVYMPIGLKKDKVDPIWVGGDERILFISPKIMTNPYYNNVYQNLKKDFGDIPHVIGGAQMIPVSDDKTVIGFVSKEEFDYNMSHLAAMYYHSQEPRHLHYHPLEAVANGMPLVFMAGGMLDRLGGKELPGRCKTVRQAHKLLKRLSKGDVKLAKKIIASQGVLLKTFEKEFCRQKWQEGLCRIDREKAREALVAKADKKIAVVIPAGYTGGILDFSIRLAAAIQRGARERGDAVSAVLYHLDDDVYKGKDYFSRARREGIPLRTFQWKEKDKFWFQNYKDIRGLEMSDFPEKAHVMVDGIADLKDCDYVIFTSDTMPAPYFTDKPYSVVIHDVIQRYVPALLNDPTEGPRQRANRKAEILWTTTEPTKQDIIQFAGISETKVRMLPQMFEMVEATADRSEGQAYFLWGTNSTPHKNHLKALSALAEYYAGGGTLDCHVTGVFTELFDVNDKAKEKDPKMNDYVQKVRDVIKGNPQLKKHVVICGELDRQSYLNHLAGAEFTFHPGYGDNGNGVAVEAAQLGVPTLSSDYPAMRYMNERMDLHFTFCRWDDPDSMAKGLAYMEKNAEKIAKEMPLPAELEKFTWQKQTKEIYEAVSKAMRGF